MGYKNGDLNLERNSELLGKHVAEFTSGLEEIQEREKETASRINSVGKGLTSSTLAS